MTLGGEHNHDAGECLACKALEERGYQQAMSQAIDRLLIDSRLEHDIEIIAKALESLRPDGGKSLAETKEGWLFGTAKEVNAILLEFESMGKKEFERALRNRHARLGRECAELEREK